jgi:hypothetical protein
MSTLRRIFDAVDPSGIDSMVETPISKRLEDFVANMRNLFPRSRAFLPMSPMEIEGNGHKGIQRCAKFVLGEQEAVPRVEDLRERGVLTDVGMVTATTPWSGRRSPDSREMKEIQQSVVRMMERSHD